MKEELLKYTCDKCKSTVGINKGSYCGTILDKEWVRLYMRLKPIDIQKTKLHFCSAKCAEKFLHIKNLQDSK